MSFTSQCQNFNSSSFNPFIPTLPKLQTPVNSFNVVTYRKIPIISPRLVSVYVQKAFLLGVFSGELIFGGAYYWREVCVKKWVELDNNNNLKH